MALPIFILEQGKERGRVPQSTNGAREGVAREWLVPTLDGFRQHFFAGSALSDSQWVGFQALELVIEGSANAQF